MIRTLKTLSLFLLVVSAASRVCAAEPRELDSVLAAVNGDPVTLGEIVPGLREREFQLRSSYSGAELERHILQLRRAAVDEVIDRKLIIADFNEKKLNIPPQEVENEIDRWGKYIGCNARADLEERLKKSGSSISEIRKKIHERMIVQVMRRREFVLAGTPTPSELLARFQRDEKKLSFPGSVELALLKISRKEPEKAKEITAALKKDPASWKNFAAIYAIGEGREGSVGAVEIDKLRPEFAKALGKAEVGRLCCEVETADGIYFLKVLKLERPRPAVIKDHAESIRKSMEEEIYRKSSADYSARLRDGAVIEYFFQAPKGVGKK